MGVEPVKDLYLDQMTEVVNEVVPQDDGNATMLHNLDQSKGQPFSYLVSKSSICSSLNSGGRRCGSSNGACVDWFSGISVSVSVDSVFPVD